MYQSIRPGQVWQDTEGKRIQAHAGAIHYENGTYYWYGENKEFTDGKSKTWVYGIRCYSSKDFYNWKDEGLIIEPNLENKKHPLHPTRHAERPHIIYNEKTKKYVCWIKEPEKSFCILAADGILGPYTMVNENYKPMGKAAGDFDIAIDEKTGKAYIYFSCQRECTYIMELEDDYLSAKPECKKLYEELHPPFIREGLSHLEADGCHYLFSSGMTGYVPNPSQVAKADTPMGEYTELGNPHVDDASHASFDSQISFIFKHPEKENFYVALADRWIPDYPMSKKKYEWFCRVIGSNYNRKKYKSTIKEKIELMKTPMMANVNTSISDYVWLPIEFENGMPRIRWQDEWKL